LAESDSAKNAQAPLGARAYTRRMHDKLVALVTGANKGIGLQIAKDLAARGLTVLVGSRDAGRGEKAAAAVGAGARALQLDVTDHASVAAAAERIRRELGRLDVLVNNAGISSTAKTGTPFAEVVAASKPSVVSAEELRAVFETNVFGLIAVTQAMLPLLREAPAGRIVNVSSTLGSLTMQSDPASHFRRMPNGSYSPSKSTVNALTIAFANELAGTRVKVNAACPGYTATDLNAFSGTRTVEEAAREPVRLALLGDDGPTGTFSNDDGTVPW
jgi:NAD(P)-dependent dehydrogenase (short-subunit alcohol dehydrogenase family)